MAHRHERHDSCPLQQVLWLEPDHRYYDLGEVWRALTQSAIVDYPDELEQRWGRKRTVHTVKVVVETAVFAGLSCCQERLKLSACQLSRRLLHSSFLLLPSVGRIPGRKCRPSQPDFQRAVEQYFFLLVVLLGARNTEHSGGYGSSDED